MTTVNLISNNLAFHIDTLVNFDKLSKCKTIIVTTVNPEDNTVYDICLKNPTCSLTDNVLNINCAKPEIQGIFGLISFLYPETESLMEIFQIYDGDIFGYNNEITLTSTRDQLHESPEKLNTTIHVITGY